MKKKEEKIKDILKEVLEEITPSKQELDEIKFELSNFLKKLTSSIKNSKINAEIFVGGSFAKNTFIRKGHYDIDIFLRFDKKYKEEEISNLTEKSLKIFKNVLKIHGSRDYFKIKIKPSLFFEIIPVIKINHHKDSKNTTDLSYLHVKYTSKKIISKKILDEIKISKAFCYANNCYGAESYIRGFSGYALELLVYYYGSFINFAKAISEAKKEKIIVDIEKDYKNKRDILMNLNSSKLQSPIILIDPVHKQRNALAALSEEKFEVFRREAAKFLKNPSKKSFEIKKEDIQQSEINAKKKKHDFVLVTIKTDRQEGDIAGSKLLKFHNHLTSEIKRFFDIKDLWFEYDGEKTARCFFAVTRKKEVIHNGPDIRDKENLKSFKREHKKTFIKNNKIYAKEKINFNIKQFIRLWSEKNSKKLNEMSIKSLDF
ncbi:MAG: nucleotidyltransferase domain-containing protein [Nanoarchaeota archaeon]